MPKAAIFAIFAFTPFVFEAEGGLGHTGRKLLGQIATDAARLTGEPASLRAEMIFQSLSVELQRANAQAVLRRAGAALPMAAHLAAARDELQFTAAEQANPAAAGGLRAV